MKCWQVRRHVLRLDYVNSSTKEAGTSRVPRGDFPALGFPLISEFTAAENSKSFISTEFSNVDNLEACMSIEFSAVENSTIFISTKFSAAQNSTTFISTEFPAAGNSIIETINRVLHKVRENSITFLSYL